MDTKHLSPNASPGLAGQAYHGQIRLPVAPGELQRLQQENTRLRQQVVTLETRLADLREMVHEFLSPTDLA
jgi:hypothetical protein